MVAEQVRKLAEQSRMAVNDSEKMITEIIKVTQEKESHSVEILRGIDAVATVSEENSVSTEGSAASAEEQAASMEGINNLSLNFLVSLASHLSQTLRGFDGTNLLFGIIFNARHPSDRSYQKPTLSCPRHLFIYDGGMDDIFPQSRFFLLLGLLF